MLASIIIPVWNGADTIVDCLAAVYASGPEHLHEIICVDNASPDEAAQRIVARFPQVKVLHQPVNLGFAGGINAGIQAAAGDCFVLLNQDCIVQPGWLHALDRALAKEASWGIAGCRILAEDGTLNHSGAFIQWPQVRGQHYQDEVSFPRVVDYVTGAAFAIRRSTWDQVGAFDADFYPAYFEESDYCYRARHMGIETVYVPDAEVRHLFTGHDWLTDRIRHTANQHQSRLRFVVKHADSDRLTSFLETEKDTIQEEIYLEHAVGRLVAARQTLRDLDAILEKRRLDCKADADDLFRRQLKTGLTDILRMSLHKALHLASSTTDSGPSIDDIRLYRTPFFPEASGQVPRHTDVIAHLQASLDALSHQQQDVQRQIYLHGPEGNGSETQIQRLWRLARRVFFLLTGRDYFLQSQLNYLTVARLEKLTQLQRVQAEDSAIQIAELHDMLSALAPHLIVMDLTSDYDYR